MDMTNYTDGTIFDNIKRLNEHMSEKLTMRIDLRSASNLAAEKDQKDLMAKIEAYLDRIGFLHDLEEKTKVQKKFIAAGISFVVVLFILFGFGAGPLCNFVGFMYPAFASFKALEANNHADDRHWLTYWVVYSCFSLVEGFLEYILFWVPFYYPIKLAFLFYLFLPQTKGAMQLYDKFLQPALKPYVSLIDEAASEVINKASNMASDIDSAAPGLIGREGVKAD